MTKKPRESVSLRLSPEIIEEVDEIIALAQSILGTEAMTRPAIYREIVQAGAKAVRAKYEALAKHQASQKKR
jgi:hypothetical protein